MSPAITAGRSAACNSEKANTESSNSLAAAPAYAPEETPSEHVRNALQLLAIGADRNSIARRLMAALEQLEAPAHA